MFLLVFASNGVFMTEDEVNLRQPIIRGRSKKSVFFIPLYLGM